MCLTCQSEDGCSAARDASMGHIDPCDAVTASSYAYQNLCSQSIPTMKLLRLQQRRLLTQRFFPQRIWVCSIGLGYISNTMGPAAR